MSIEREEVIVRMGMDTRPLEQGAGRAASFMDNYSKKLVGKLNQTMMGIFGLDLVSTIKPQLESLIDYASKKLADFAYGTRWQKLAGGLLEENRQGLHKQVRDRDEAAAAREKERDNAAKERSKLLEEFDRVSEARAEKRRSLDEEIKVTQEKILDLKNQISGANLNDNNTLRTTIELQKQLMHMDALQNEKKTAGVKDLKANEPQRRRLGADLTSGQFDATIKRIADLEQDAHGSFVSGNMSRGMTDMNIANQLRQGIRSRLIQDEQAANKETPEQRVMRTLIDSISPGLNGSNGGIPVKIMNTDE